MKITEKIRQQKRAWAKKNRDKENTRYDRWKKKNPERYRKHQRKWREKNREHKNAYDRKWCEDNPLKIKLKSLNRKRYSKQAGHLSVSDVNFIYQRDKKCLCCGGKEHLTVDHIIPLINDGKNIRDNLQILCLSCNDKKGIKVIDYRQ